MSPLDYTAGATGDQAPKWVRFTDAALSLLESDEAAYALIFQVVECVEAYEGGESVRAS